jgi:hypothetical protein
MLDFLLEVVFQIVFELVGEFLLHVGFKGAAAVVRSRVTRYVVAVVGGFAAGAFWGGYLADQGAGHRPRLFWVSLAIGGVMATVAAMRVRNGDPYPSGFGDDRWRDVGLPWQWPAFRLIGFSLLNFALAAGIAVGYTPHIPR